MATPPVSEFIYVPNVGRDAVVSGPGSPTRVEALLHGHRYLVCRLYHGGNGPEQRSSLPRRLRDRSDLQDIPVNTTYILRSKRPLIHSSFFLFVCSVLGTPSEATWPNVSQLPDYKPTFPQWSPTDLTDAVPEMEPVGVDLLKVRPYQSYPGCVKACVDKRNIIDHASIRYRESYLW